MFLVWSGDWGLLLLGAGDLSCCWCSGGWVYGDFVLPWLLILADPEGCVESDE